MSRIKAREAAFALLYAWQLNRQDERPFMDVLKETVEIENIEEDDLPYIQALVQGCKGRCGELDSLIERHSVDWKTERMPRVDLAILRIGVHELLYDKTVPVPVVMNQCVELAKRYSTEKSGAFIHGVLSAVAKGMDN